MPKCGCQSSRCSCVIQGGQNTVVTGAGTTENPLVVSVPDMGVTTVHDTPTVDMSIDGEGTSADPYDVSGVVKVSTAPGNILTVNGDGLMVACEAVADCAPPAGAIAVDCGLEGVGSPEVPLQVKGLVPWNFACPETRATPLYCLADGSIAGPPPNTCKTEQVGLGPAVGMAGFCTLVPTTATRTRLSSQPNRMQFENPDPCRPMLLEIKASGVIYITGDNADGTNPNQWVNQLLIGLMINGAAGSVVQQVGIMANGQLNYRIDYPTITVPPGGAVQIGSYVDGQVDVACHVENSQFQHPNIIAVGRTCG